ncbi:MAG: metallophosphoesterase [Candidatus Neomarinimicrobiota bacterium]|jgi:sugar phosphate isomerase/epimerase|nr:metallophosphoesterase [Candidatus Neomarinimicrobiota bacterium]MDD3966823.1 metallophosphoesterase [Candidatus Neomarinimicrobiota bacterium]MDX9780896.1 metallophosphoesterase [bacterium]
MRLSYLPLSTALILIIILSLSPLSPLKGASADTLRMIQSPLVNIPVIALPGDSISVDIFLPEAEQLVFVSLLQDEREIELPFRPGPEAPFAGEQRIRAKLPESMLYGMYDIKIYSSGNPGTDLSENALYVIPSYKEKYTFIHITDTHLPSHKFWDDYGVENDSSEMDDFREVIRDINLINPAFVLHTGDLINDGELEALGIPAISRAKKILKELEVPVFLVPGNHDLGGWDATPAPDGTARRFWWKYFGWHSLNNTAASAVNTQNYAFRYGAHAYIGLESYVNYDRWREDIYGYQGFTSAQLQWLNSTVDAHSDADLKVLFYHYDFEDQLDLQVLGVDAAFWGHVHYNSGNTSAKPLNLSTGAVCDGRRWYRIVKVEDNSITQTWSIQAGEQGEILNEVYSADALSVTLANNSVMDFEDCRVKFPLPQGKRLLSLENAELYQIDSLSIPKMVYARTNLPANSQVTVSMEIEDIPETSLSPRIPLSPEIRHFPNPFNPRLQIRIGLPADMHIRTEITDLQGRSVALLNKGWLPAGTHTLIWDAADFPSGIYLLRTEAAQAGYRQIFMEKCLLIK